MDTGMPMGAPPSGPPPMGPPPGGPPDAKRQRREGLVLEPEEEFLQKYPGPSKVSLCAKCLLVAYDWTTSPFNGSCLAIGSNFIASSGTFTAQSLMIMHRAAYILTHQAELSQ